MRIYSTQFLMNQYKAILSDLAYPLTITGRMKRYLNDYQIHGNSVQDGTPTPDTPVEVQSVGELVTEGTYAGMYRVPVVVRGKNLFDVNKYPLTKGRWINTSNGTSIANSDNYACTLDYVPCAELIGKTITISRTTGYNPGVCFYNENKTFMSSVINNDGTKITTVVPVDATFMRMSVNVNYTDTVQIEEGSAATDFEPYIEPATTDIYLDVPLRKIGDYADYIDFKNRQVVRRVGEEVFTGNESCSTQPYETDNTYLFMCRYLVTNRHTEGSFSKNLELCNMLPNLKATTQNTNNDKECFSFNASTSYANYLYIRINKNRLTDGTKEAFQAWLKSLYNNGTPMKFYYAFEEPVNEAVDLPSILQFKGETIYQTETAISPSGIQVKYY